MNWRALFLHTEARPPGAVGFRSPSLKFWAVNALILAASYLLVFQPIRDAIAAGDDALAEQRLTLGRYESVAAQASAIESYAKQVATGNERGEFIAGENEGIVAANLQARLKTVAEDAKVAVRSLQMLPSKSVQGASLVGARLEVAGSLPAVHTLARNLESDAPLLIISDANLRTQTLFWGAAVDKEPEIEAIFDVFGAAAPRPAH